jgi:hypothetical protein
MASRYPAPNEESVDAALGALVSAPHQVARVPSAEPEREPTGAVAEYVTTDGNTLAAIAFADRDAVNFVGGAVAAVEVETIQKVNGGGTLHDGALESFREIANSLGTCLNGDFTPPLQLSAVHRLPGELTEEIKQLWRKPGGKRGFRLTVNQYGSGTIILYLI